MKDTIKMSKAAICQYNDIIQSREEKLTSMLISEIIFLKSKIKRRHDSTEIKYLEYGLDKLEYLLNKLKIHSPNMAEKDFDKILMLIYHIFKEITLKLE